MIRRPSTGVAVLALVGGVLLAHPSAARATDCTLDTDKHTLTTSIAGASSLELDPTGVSVGGRGHEDTLLGGHGSDTLRGGFGNDACDGGAGAHDTASGCEIVDGVP